MKEKKGWSVERIAKTAVLTAGIFDRDCNCRIYGLQKSDRSERKINYKIDFRRNSSDSCFYSCNVDLQGKKK